MLFSELCIRRPVLTTLVTATFIVFGPFAYRLLPVAALPAVDFPTISVTATLPGASAENMAVAVAAPIERQMSTISGINSITSVSTLGRTQIVILFNLNRNIDGAALDVQTALTVAQRRLPIEMTVPPSFRKVNPGESAVVFISANSATLPLSTVDEYAEVVLGQQMSQIPGVAQVDVYGSQKFAVRVQVDPVAAAARNVSLDEIRRVLIATNSNSPVGTLYGPRQNITLLATNAMRHADEYKDVVVIYLFLRSASATIIPALAVPVSLIGTCAAMYALGFSVNNMTMLALTLSVGFVVDDAIVMLENIVRHVEGGMRPFEAALKGAQEIGFTIIAITFSLIAVFIPVLLMGGMVGRMFREFAVTIAVAILISGFVSLTLTPMLCARVLKVQHEGERQILILRIFERMFLGWLKAYEWSLD